ncbi:tectonin domain-containing protein [Paremcibacter congregatus]|uniref:tectonin domain-containing protein n=1 Tax=Paremcibacter congregatus TaxID=2043170 RepID=UPI003A934BC9
MASSVWQARRYLGLVLAGIFALVLCAQINSAHAQNYQTQDGYEGHAICGAADLRTGQLLPACGFEPAKYESKAVGKCPTGSFFDVGLWACYSCPAGFNRTANAVDSAAACSKAVATTFLAATKVGKQEQCPAGTVTDPRNGGECWQCPSGFARTMAPVTDWNACGKAFASARSAELVGTVCPQGSFGDPNGNCYTCPANSVRTAEAVTHPRACVRTEELVKANFETALTCKSGEVFDFIDGGTCWSCPEGSVRTVDSVKSAKACEFTTMRWEAQPRTPNGLFAVPGGMEIAVDVISNPKEMEDVIRAYMADQKITDEAFFNESMETLKKEPEDSAALRAAVYQRVTSMITKGTKTQYERDLLLYFAAYIQQTRLLSAQEMKNAWDSWQRGVELRNGEVNMRTNMANVYNTGYAPPDMEALVGTVVAFSPAGAIGATYAGAAFAQAQSQAFHNAAAAVARFITPHRFAKPIAAITQKAAEKLAQQGVSKAASLGLGITSGGLMVPFMFVSAASIVASIAGDIATQQDKQDAIVKDALAKAQRPINLQRLMLSEDGRNEMLTNWTLMTQEAIKPNPARWASLMQAAAFGTSSVDGTKWVDYNQVARDIAIGSDDSVYILSDKLLKTRYEPNSDGSSVAIIENAADGEPSKVLKFNKQTGKFDEIPGLAASSIAVAGNVLWGINDKKQVFYAYGSRAPFTIKVVPGAPATEIGAGEGNIWMLDNNGTPYRFAQGRWIQEPGQAASVDVDRLGQAWAVNANKEVWTREGERWVRLSGAGTDVAVFQENHGYVVGADGKIYAYQPASKNWKTIGNNTNAIRIATGGTQLWRITKDNKVSQWR